MSGKFTRTNLSVAVLLASGLFTGSAMAQQLEEVIVTAQKRVASLQDTPIAISAFNAEAIQNMGLIDAKDIGMASPYLQMPAYPTSSNNLAIFIRGIGNADSIVITKDPTVGLYYDGVYAARSTGLLADLSDLERVEILRGPQGTLYGRNTMAGAINFINAKPTGEFGFKQSLSAGDYDSWRSVSHLSLPDASGFKSKFTATFSDRDGWVENEGANEVPGYEYADFYKKETEGYRAALRYDGVEKLLVDYSYDYSDITSTAPYFQYGGPTGGLTAGFVPITNSFPNRLKETRTPTGGQEFAYYLPESTTEVNGHNLTASYEINDQLTFKSITGYRDYDDDNSTNFAQSFGDAGSLEVWTKTEQDQWSQEFQLIGSAERLEYVGGLYYFNENGEQKERQFLDRAAVDEQGVYAFDFITGLPCSDGTRPGPICTDFANATFPNYLGEYTVKTDVESWAGYGQGTWTPNVLEDKLDLTLGLRYTDDERDATRTNDGWVFNSFAPGATDSQMDRVDYTAIADYSWTDNVSTYAKISTGFRSGGSSRNGLDFNQPFDKEDLISYELGWKSEMLDQRVRVNGATYFMQVNDIILDYLPDPILTPQFVESFNSGDTDIYGLEIDADAAITDQFFVGFNFSYLNYEFNDTIFPDGSDNTDTTELVWAPEYAYALTADYTVPVSVGELLFHVDYSWQDEQFALANTDSGKVEVADYGLWNGRISLGNVEMAGHNWQFALWGRNLTDEDTANYLIGSTASTYLAPRMWGAEVIFEF
jgi:iron complex outermembrane receptor protein